MDIHTAAPLKWHGGKAKLARRLLQLLPRHARYVEPFAGGLALLLARDPDDRRLWWPGITGVAELVNDLDGRLAGFWRVLREPDLFASFARQAQATPYARQVWEEAAEHAFGNDLVRDAWALFVLFRQSRGGRGAGWAPSARVDRKPSGDRPRVRRGMADNVSAWLAAVDGLTEAHARLSRVEVENVNALDLLAREEADADERTCYYLDPPYLGECRTCPEVYGCELDRAGHERLLGLVRRTRARVMLSGYASPLYERELGGWRRVEFDLPNHAAGGAGRSHRLSEAGGVSARTGVHLQRSPKRRKKAG